jgi:hypothetical protein
MFSLPTFTATIITLEPCALNPDLIYFHYFADATERGDRG